MPSSRWGDKTPYLIFELAMLKKIFPNSRFIHLHRDPKEVVGSRMLNFNESQKVALKRWMFSVEEAYLFKKKYPSDLLEISYKELREDSEVVLAKMLNSWNCEN